MSVPSVPFLDLVAPHLEMEAELTAIFQQALRTASFVGGPVLEGFEAAFASFCRVDHCVGVANGTDALLFALRAVGIAAGDVVVTTPNTFIATAEAIVQAGALPEFVDVDERTSNIDPAALERYLESGCSRDASGRSISRRSGRPVTAVVPVHLYGQMADMDAIADLADRFGLLIVEDACQAHGAEYLSRVGGGWRPAGSIGRAAAFSFYPGKNLGACGEAGAVTTNHAAVALTVRKLRDHGQGKKYYHDVEGYNGRLDAIQAGILHAKLGRLAEWNARRRELAERYSRLLSDVAAIGLPHEPEWSRGVYHLYVITLPERDGLIAHLGAERIGAGIHYPIPLHLQEASRVLGYQRGDFPVSERLAAGIVSLPMYPQLTTAQQARVVAEVLKFVRK